MSKVLLVYATNSGSTAEVAEAVAAELRLAGHSADVQPVQAAPDPSAYDAVVLGAPMIFGWHSAIRRYLRRQRAALAGKKTAWFACAMRLTEIPGEAVPPLPLMLDPNLVSGPAKPGRLGIKERITTLGYYLAPMLQAAPGVTPVSVAFFGGKLEMFRLRWWQAAFILAVVQAPPGDRRDWSLVRAWAKSLSARL